MPTCADEHDDGQIGKEDRKLRVAAGGGHPPEETCHERQVAEGNRGEEEPDAGVPLAPAFRQNRGKTRGKGMRRPGQQPEPQDFLRRQLPIVGGEINREPAVNAQIDAVQQASGGDRGEISAAQGLSDRTQPRHHAADLRAGGVERWDNAVGAERRQEDRDQHDASDGRSERRIACPVELTERVLGSAAQEDAKSQHKADPGADIAENVAQAHERRALVIAAGEFRHQCRAGELMQADEEPRQDREQREPSEERRLRPAGRRPPEEGEGDSQRYRDAIEIRVPSSPAAAGSVGNLSDERIPDRVEHHGSRNNGADRRRRQPEQLIVEKQQQTEQLSLRAERDRAEAVGQPSESIGHPFFPG